MFLLFWFLCSPFITHAFYVDHFLLCAWLSWSVSYYFVIITSRDLNPLHDVISNREYKEKYYKSLMPLSIKYAEVSFVLLSLENLVFVLSSSTILKSIDFSSVSMQLLPWGGKLTGESLRFFSPIVIWTRFTSSQHKGDILFDAFNDYYKVQNNSRNWFISLLIWFIDIVALKLELEMIEDNRIALLLTFSRQDYLLCFHPSTVLAYSGLNNARVGSSD